MHYELFIIVKLYQSEMEYDDDDGVGDSGGGGTYQSGFACLITGHIKLIMLILV